MEKEKSAVSLLSRPQTALFGMSRLPSLLKNNVLKKTATCPSSTPLPPSTTVVADEEQKLDEAFAVEPLVRQITFLDSNFYDNDSSDIEAEVLSATENEAKSLSMNYEQVKLFDKSMRINHRRYIEQDLDELDSDDIDSDEANIPEEDFIELFRAHIKRKKMRKKIRVNPELTLGAEKINDAANKTPKSRKRKGAKEEDLDKDSLLIEDSSLSKVVTVHNKRGRKGGDKTVSTDQLNTRRRRLWLMIVRKELGKAQKSRNFNLKEKLGTKKRLANQCMRSVRQKAMISQRIEKEKIWRAKRLTREMQAYWKRFGRVERQQKRQLEKVEEEQRKLDLQLLEAKRQQRKLNFLITQTELYAHFLANKIGAKGFGEDEAAILNKLDEAPPATLRLAELDDYDSERAKAVAMSNAQEAVEANKQQMKRYDVDILGEEMKENAEHIERNQPSLFRGSLKNYQLKGMNWLLNLYEQGINGILADEMGLGKTVQSLAMLASIAEIYNIWGPFLVITPASTLHNWQQEVAKFLPDFKVVPYWGSPQERKVLRHFWDQTNLHTRSASFHLVITSYQLVVTDFKYFNRIKWQYLVLDEAQAIKSSSSQRWKMLLEFRCRNRLLLSGTPIQNSMAELWSLLHFVMPTLFDSHEEFNDWFSKDIESSAENKSQIDEKQISRLHMILKPFMLRRIKKDVENELTDKLEVLMYCPLTTRQKLLYLGLKRKIRIEDLLQGLGSQSQNSALTTSLMNLVMQFRKVCNHPELFERREARSPFYMDIGPHVIPKLVFHDRLDSNLNSRRHLIDNKLCIFNSFNVHRSLFPQNSDHEYLEVSSSPFSFLRFVDLSPGECFDSFLSLLKRWIQLAKEIKKRREKIWFEKINSETPKFARRRDLLIFHPPTFDSELSDLVFTSNVTQCVLSHNDVVIRSVPETMEHRILRTKHQLHFKDIDHIYQNLVPEVSHIPRPDIIRTCQPCQVPKFLLSTCLKVATPGRLPYAFDRSFAWHLKDHLSCTNEEGGLCVKYGLPQIAEANRLARASFTQVPYLGGIFGSRPALGYSNIIVPDKETLIFDSGKLFVLDGLLARLKAEGHRVLIYSQMTRMIDLLEEFMIYRKHTFMRLDGSSKIHERRDMVADFQERSDIFAFLLSTRAGGLGINLTAADTVIFYDSDWNPTVDQQAMDRAHRLGQTKQVTVYRLICKGTIEERILQRAREKSAIQQMVIQGGSFKGKPGDFKAKEVVSLLLDDEEIERKYKEQKQQMQDKDKKRKRVSTEASSPCSDSSSRSRFSASQLSKKLKLVKENDSLLTATNSCDEDSTTAVQSECDDSITGIDVESCESRDTTRPASPLVDFLGEKLGPKRQRTGGKRGRPRGTVKPSGISRENSAHENSFNSPSRHSSPYSGKRGPGRPRIKAGGTAGPLNQGSRGPLPKLFPGLQKA